MAVYLSFLLLFLKITAWSVGNTADTRQYVFSPLPSQEVSSGEPVHISSQDIPQAIPLVTSLSYDEAVIQKSLRQGAVVIGGGERLGQPGNTVIAAHSSGQETFGAYREAFAQLDNLVVGKQFTITTTTNQFTYTVVATEIVAPQEIDKLPQDDRSTVTLVTCWPRWTDFKRLLVHGELAQVQGVDKSQ